MKGRIGRKMNIVAGNLGGIEGTGNGAYPGIAVLVGYPHKRNTAGEDPDAAAHLGLAVAFTSQLKPMRGKSSSVVFGTLLVATSFSMAISELLNASLATGFLLNIGMSARRP